MTIAAVVLTKNEERNIARCLGSLNWVDGLVVLDSGSMDRTREIALEHRARVVVHVPEAFLVDEQRNWALRDVDLKCDWVLFLDADEVVTPQLRSAILSAMANAPQSTVAYRLKPRFMFMGAWLRHCQGQSNWHDRLLRRGRVHFAGGVWEHFVCDGEVGYIHEPYLHYAVSKGLADWFDRHNRYSSFDARDIGHTLGFEVEREFAVTRRKRLLRNLSGRFWPLRPLARFLYMYLVRLGFLDGFPGLVYCLMVACYEMMTLLKVIELRHRAKGLAL